MMKYNRHKDRPYSYGIGSTGACWIV